MYEGYATIREIPVKFDFEKKSISFIIPGRSKTDIRITFNKISRKLRVSDKLMGDESLDLDITLNLARNVYCDFIPKDYLMKDGILTINFESDKDVVFEVPSQLLKEEVITKIDSGSKLDKEEK